MDALEILIKHDIKPSVQRLAVMEYMLTHFTHPTVDEIYSSLSPSIPTLSKTTIYNTLNLFEEQGVVLYLGIDKKNARFDGNTSRHEFSSLLLAVLNLDGLGKNLPDALIEQRIKNLKGEIHLKSYISLTCTNCPDVVQALNVMAILNPAIKHEIIDGGIHQSEVEKLNIQAVPSVYLNDELLHAA